MAQSGQDDNQKKWVGTRNANPSCCSELPAESSCLHCQPPSRRGEKGGIMPICIMPPTCHEVNGTRQGLCVVWPHQLLLPGWAASCHT